MNDHPLGDRAIDCLDGNYGYIDALRLYYVYFKAIPSLRKLRNVDPGKAGKWIEDNCKVIGKHQHDDVGEDPFSDGSRVILYVLEERIILLLEQHHLSVIYDGADEKRVEEMAQIAHGWKKGKPRDVIGMVIYNHGHLDTQYVKYKKPDLDLSRHYNDDLGPVHDKLLQIITEKDRSGIILFHGAPGTGKSTYIRYLVSHTDKKIIFITPELAGSMGSPEIAKFLIQNANTVFVIEDAEKLIVSRDRQNNSSISTLLNLTDGILGESLGIQIIATFNTELYNIDKALLRKGRMLTRYEFKPLVQDKARQLLIELGYMDVAIDGPMPLAEIFNFEEESFEIKREGIGFRH